MSSRRSLRVRELLKREIGEAVRRELPVQQAGLVTVNDVEMSSDLKSARVFIGIFGNAEQQRTGLVMLREAQGRIRAHVAKAVFLKFVPQLRFFVDDSVERGNRVLAIMDEIESAGQPASKPETE